MTATSTALTTGDITNEGKNANFTVTLTNPKASEAVRYIYPAAMLAASVATDAAVNADANVKYEALATQDGTLTNLASKLDLAIFDGSLTSEAALPASATLANQLAILAVTLKDDAETPAEITSSITGMTIGDGTNKYSVTRSAAAGPIYVAIRPVASAKIEITATDGTKNYTKSLTQKTYEASNGYSVSWRMVLRTLSTATKADCGMVVCTAGHLHTAKTATGGCTAVGVLGTVNWKGGLILSLNALNDAWRPEWEYINSWESAYWALTWLKKLPVSSLGSLSITALGSTPVSNWCVAQSSDYQEIFTNLGSTKGYSQKTYDANVNAYITGAGGTALGQGQQQYWSATDRDTNDPWYFTSSGWSSGGPNSQRHIRPVLGF